MRTVAIVGSRSRTDREAVAAVVAALPADAVVISGGASGPDRWAVEAARERGLSTRVLRPNRGTISNYGTAVRAYHARNQDIAAACDEMIAFPSTTKGGTDHAIAAALKLGKPVSLH